MPIGSAFHERTLPLCESLNYREWAGYYTVSVFEAHHEHEYNAIRNAAALIDVSPLFKYMVTGPDATKLVDRLVTRDVSRLGVGQVMYTPWCDEQGKVMRRPVSRMAENRQRWPLPIEPSWFVQTQRARSGRGCLGASGSLAVQDHVAALLAAADAASRTEDYGFTSGESTECGRYLENGIRAIWYEIDELEGCNPRWERSLRGGSVDLHPAGMVRWISRASTRVSCGDVDYSDRKGSFQASITPRTSGSDGSSTRQGTRCRPRGSERSRRGGAAQNRRARDRLARVELSARRWDCRLRCPQPRRASRARLPPERRWQAFPHASPASE